MNITAHAPILIVVAPLIAAFLNIIIGLWRRRFCHPLAVFALGASFILSVIVMAGVLKNGTIHYLLGGWKSPWGIEYVMDRLSAFMAVIVSFMGIITAVYSKKSVEKELDPDKIVYFYTIYLMLTAGLLGMIAAGDLFNIFVFMEIASLSAYSLIAMGGKASSTAGLRYLIMGTVGASFYLLGVGYLYIVTGSLNIADLSRLLPALYHSRVVLAAFALFMAGISIKAAFFPLHTWLPDAYTYAPSTVSAIAASTMTKVGAYLIIRVMFTLFEPKFSIEVIPMTAIFGWMASAAMIAGSALAIAQKDLKRMISYALIAEMGYIIMGISLGNREGFTGALLHILNDAFMMAALFLAAGAVFYRIGTREMRNFCGLGRKMPFTMTIFAVAAASMAGVPPTAGFFSKWYLLLGAIKADNFVFAGALIISSLLIAAAFFRVLEGACLSRPEGEKLNGQGSEAPLSMLAPMLVTTAGILILGIYSGRIISSIIRFVVPEGF